MSVSEIEKFSVTYNTLCVSEVEVGEVEVGRRGRGGDRRERWDGKERGK